MLKEIPLRNGSYLSMVMVSTALGIDGTGIFPRTLNPSYRMLMSEIKKTDTVVIGKSFTFLPRIGNFRLSRPWTWKYIQNIGSNGMLNAYGLTNDGYEREGIRISRSILDGNKIIPSFFPELSLGTEEVISATKTVITSILRVVGEKLAAVEINISCPNMKKEVVSKNVSDAIALAKGIRIFFPHLTLIFKISVVHPYELAQELERIGIDIIHAVNTIPYSLVYPSKESPLAHVGGGGVSGGPAREIAMKYNRDLRKKVSIPIIMGCGVCRPDDVWIYEDIGADAVIICTTALRNPKPLLSGELRFSKV